MKISLWVIGVHVLCVLFAFSSGVKNKDTREKLVVKIIALQPKPKQVPPQKSEHATAAIPKKAPSPQQKKESAPPVKNNQKGSPKSPTPTKKKGDPVKKKPVQKQDMQPVVPTHLLRELEETMAKLDDKKVVKKSRTQTASPLQSESYALETGRQPDNYQEMLVLHLHQSLHLPDLGEVKIQITLTPDGTCKKLQVLHAESQKNRQYLQEHLPRLHFPPLNGTSEKKESTFILTFCNEL
jgi:outer membrane biosynthesis protein TonB